MKTMTTSFKRSHAGTATLSAPDRAAGDSQARLGQSVVVSLLLSPGSLCTNVLFVPSKSLFPQDCLSSVSPV